VKRSNIFYGRLALFGTGVLFYAVMLRMIAISFYPSPANRTLIDNLKLNLCFALVGGFANSVSMTSVLKKAWSRQQMTSVQLILKSGLYSLAAAFVSLQLAFLSLSGYLTLQAKSSVPDASVATSFLLSLMSIEVYGFFVIIWCSPLAFVNGILTGAAIVAIRRRMLGARPVHRESSVE